MDVLKEIKVTNSYLGLDQDVRGCQNDEPLFNCTTRHLIENMVKQCHCLPFNLKLAHNIGKVPDQGHTPYTYTIIYIANYNNKLFVHRNLCVMQKNLPVLSMY